MPKVLGISGFYHDSAAALVDGENILAAAQEERFTRKKHDPQFPTNAIEFCLESQGLKVTDLDAVVFYDKPFLTFERLLETYLSYVPVGFPSFIKAMPVWIQEKLFLKSVIKKKLAKHSNLKTSELPELLFNEHHRSHAASTFFTSPYEKSAVLCLDGVGEWATTSAWLGEGNQLKDLWQINFPHSLGLLYSAFTYYCGFKVNSGEYKLMGLAPYGNPKYVDTIKENLIDIKDDGSFRLNLSFFNFMVGLRMTSKKFHKLFNREPRPAESQVTQFDMDLAASIQVVTEEIVIKLARTITKETGTKNLCLAGGVALNCVANGKLLKEDFLDGLYIQPAAGDAGGALGAALSYVYEYKKIPRTLKTPDNMKGAYLGPAFKSEDVEHFLKTTPAKYHHIGEDICKETAKHLASEKVVGWFQGAMEFGPRALGNRSILGDPRSSEMQKTMNLKIKYRESFRPFAPSILKEKTSEFFDLKDESPYMLLVAPVAESKRESLPDNYDELFGLEKLNTKRSQIPAITHVDFSARVQSVSKDTNPRYYELISEFNAITGCPLVVNTSFNVRGEPIVCTPEDAYRCFLATEMDTLVLGDYLLKKEEQSQEEIDKAKKRKFALD